MHILVTGAAGVLGRAVAGYFEGLGHRVTALDMVAPAGRVTGHVVDLSDPRATGDIVAAAVGTHGKIDALVHLVGAFNWIPVADSTLEDWRSLFEVNVLTTVNMIHAATPHMLDGAAIVCVGAASAQPARSGMAAYGAAKSGVARLVEALSEELQPRRIRVNAVAPAIIDTPRNRADMPGADPANWTSPLAVAEAIAFLASSAARGVTGAVLPVTNAA